MLRIQPGLRINENNNEDNSSIRETNTAYYSECYEK